MNWVYILLCEDDIYYVGQTERLYRRCWEHEEGRGGINTSTYSPIKIVAIYKVDDICEFLYYNRHVVNRVKNFDDKNIGCQDDKLYAENNIAECLMIHRKTEWEKIRGGKYVKLDCKYKYPDNEYIKELPLCECGLPCDIRKNKTDNYFYFRCAKKNMWDDFKEIFDIEDEPCHFFMKYTQDEQRRIKLKELFKQSPWLKNVEINDGNYPRQCVAGCNRTSQSIKLSYHNQKRNLCYDCFIEKNDELKSKYDETGKRLLKTST